MDNGYRVTIGGPSYEMRTDARHTVAVATLGLAIQQWGGPQAVYAYHYRHGVPVEMARNELFARDLQSEATHLIWVDSDVYWHSEAGENHEIVKLLTISRRRKLPFIGIPCPLRADHSQANVWLHCNGSLYKATMYDVTAISQPVGGMGLGFAIFNLDVYREKWPDGPWFYTHWTGGEAGKGVFCSEDLVHTAQLKARCGNPPWCYPVVELVHAERGGPGKRSADAIRQASAQTPHSAGGE